ncbi:MAG: putative lipid II flippase FtsW [Myxococcota bacterium]
MKRNLLPAALLLSVLVLTGMGLVMTYSGSAFVTRDPWFFAKRQWAYAAAAALGMAVAVVVPVGVYRRAAYPLYALALGVLVLVLVPGVGHSVRGAARWLRLGPVHVQGGELLKMALVCFLAMSLAKKGPKMLLFRVGIVPHLLLPGVAVALLLAEPDFGTAVLAVAVTGALLFVGGARAAYLVGLLVLAVPLGLHAITSSPYRLRRLVAFLDPWSHRQGAGYQVVESLIALGSGKLGGTGVGHGTAKLHFLPDAHTDFVLALIGQEWGFIGVSVAVLCFVTIAVAGFGVAARQTDPFCRYLAAGLTTTLVLQAVINVFVTLGIVPTKGMGLPFVSYGGSSLLVSCWMAGMLLQLALRGTTPNQ